MKVEICTKRGRVNNLQLTCEAEILCNIFFINFSLLISCNVELSI